jgi:CheY-like chemotaxis protein/DNA-binding XRE family transcriptional regulator
MNILKSFGKPDAKKRFGSSVKIWRNQLGLSQEELAERSDLHRTYISDVERGARNLSLLSMEKLAAALQVSISDFFIPLGLGGEGAEIITHHDFYKKFVEVLLVEDNADDVDLTLHAFKQARFTNQINVLRDGEEALDFIFCRGSYAGRNPNHRSQIMLLDLNLPKLSGLEVLRQIRADKKTRHLTVVVLTVSQQSRDMEECERLGVASYIVKPVNFQSLIQATPPLNLDWALLKPAAMTAG